MPYLLRMLLCMLIPALAYADIFPSNANDQSILYLGKIFGHMGSVLLPANANQLFPAMFRIFNIMILTIGTIMLTYTTVIAAIHTAQEGEMMGKKWSSVWMPLRSAVGIAILVPASNGYSMVQIAMMWIIIQGVGAANQIWNVVLTNYASGYSVSIPAPIIGLDAASKSLFASAVCMEYFNNQETTTPGYLQGLFGASVPVGAMLTGYYNSSPSAFVIGLDPNNPANVAPSGNLASTITGMCGQLPLSNGGPELAAVQLGFESYTEAATEAVTVPCNNAPTCSNWAGTGQRVLSRGMGLISDGLTSIRQSTTVNGSSSTNANSSITAQVAESAKQDGWMYAGSFYFTLVNATKDQGLGDSLQSFKPTDLSSYQSATLNAAVSSYSALAKTYAIATQPAANDNTNHSMNTGGYNGGGSSGGDDLISQSLGEIIRSVVDYFMGYMTSGAKVYAYSNHAGGGTPDPLLSMGKLGMGILNVLETIWVSTIIVIFALMLVSAVMSGFQPAGHALLSAFQSILPMIIAVMAILVPVGVMLGIYMPMIPYMLYLSGVIAWFILCIEAITAAPIVALGLAAPGEDEFGKAKHAIMLCLNLFLRPPLMVIAFVAASRLLIAVFTMFNYSFTATLFTQVGSTGMFGSVALLSIFTGIVVSLTNECFSLIHILPDKTLRWIGGQGDGLAASIGKEITSEAKQKSETGAEMAHQTTKAATDGATALSQGLMQKKGAGNTDAGGNMPGGQGGP